MKKRAAWFVLAGCTLYFLWMAREGFRSVLVADDYMNAYSAFMKPWSALWGSQITAAGNNERALGLLLYRAIFESVGLDPRFYRAAGMTLLLANLVLAWLLMQRWVGIAGLTAGLFAFCYHAFLADLYLSTGTIFDLLCGAAVLGAMLVYRRERQGWGERVAIFALALCAVNAKEIGFVLPGLLMAYEIVVGRRRGHWLSLFFGSLPAAWALLLRLGQPSWMGNNTAYQLHLDAGFISTNLAQYFRQLFFLTRDLRMFEVAGIAGFSGVAALWFRGPALFGWVWFWMAAAPVLVIDPRSLYALYVAYFGGCLFLGSVVERIRPRWGAGVAATLLVCICMARNLALQEPARQWYRQLSWEGPAAETAWKSQFPTLPRGAVIYVADDPYDEGNWLVAFAGHLLYHDRDLMVRRKKQGFARPAETYGDLIVVRQP